MARTWTEEEKKAFGEKMKAARAKKQTEQVTVEDKTPKTEVPYEAPTPDTEVNQESVADLKRQIDELKSYLFDQKQSQAQGSGLGVNNQGNLVGMVEKYLVDPAAYPSPVERLMKEARLAPFAFDVNYEIDYQVQVSQYQTKDGVNTREPRFHLELRKVRLDDLGNPTDERIIARRMVFHEDPQAAIEIARENGLPIDESNERDFLNEMRYLRARDWLLDIFYPKPAQPAQSRREEVIDNQMVQIISINSEDAQGIPFNQIKR